MGLYWGQGVGEGVSLGARQRWEMGMAVVVSTINNNNSVVPTEKEPTRRETRRGGLLFWSKNHGWLSLVSGLDSHFLTEL